MGIETYLSSLISRLTSRSSGRVGRARSASRLGNCAAPLSSRSVRRLWEISLRRPAGWNDRALHGVRLSDGCPWFRISRLYCLSRETSSSLRV
jgi:hypothetical protein